VNDELLTLTAELAYVMRLAEDDDVAAILQRFVTRAARTIPGCDHAAIITRSEGAVEILASSLESDPPVLQPGPVIEALTFREPRRLDDTATDQRWPAFAAELTARGYRSCLALPLVTNTDPAAILVLYSAEPDRFSDTSYDLVLLFALHAGVVFDNAALYHDSRKLVDHLRTALRTRTLIGNAQGLLMHRNSYGAEGAFTALRTASQNNNIKLRDLAAQLVAAHERDELDAVVDKLGLNG
jgi:GAF domain-containing protein